MFPLTNQYILWKLSNSNRYYVSKVIEIIDDHLKLQDVWATRGFLVNDNIWVCTNYKNDKGLFIVDVFDDFSLSTFNEKYPELFI